MLQTLTAWWKYPPLLDDPFDMQITPLLGCTEDEIATASIPAATDWLRSDRPIPPTMASQLATIIATYRPVAHFLDLPTEAEAFAIALRRALATSMIPNALVNAKQQWDRWLKGVRVFCVSATNVELHMWALYGENHRGAVLGMRALDGRGPLRAAFPMAYAANMPVMGTAEQWVNHVFGVAAIDFHGFFRGLIETKSLHWQYQQEWRCLISDVDPARDVPGMPGVWACPILPEEVAAVYLGARMPAAERAAIIDVVRSRVPNAEVYEAVQSPDQFALTFRRLI